MKNALDIFHRIATELLEDEKKHPVAEYIPTSELFSRLDLDLTNDPISDEVFETILKDLIFASPRTATTGFFNQLFGGRNEKALLGELLSVLLNNSMYTYKAAGPQIGVEKKILRTICNMIGWDENSDGTLAAGGSMTNFMSMILARDAASDKVRNKGLTERMTIYTSNESHYSLPKNAAFCGIGRENVRYIPTDDVGRIDVQELDSTIKKDIQNGLLPVLVNLTAGTTVIGAFDPITPAADICKKHKIWLHIDGAYCGSVIFSKKYKHLVQGVELVDSFSFNAHKMLSTPLSCSIIVVKDKKHLYDSFSNDANYLYQTHHDEFNLGKTSLQCGRRNDALKFWALWKSVGTSGLEAIVDHQFALADTARDYVRNHKDYTLYSYDNSVSICFNYKGIPARDICTALYEHSNLLVGYGSFKCTEFIRLVTVNASNSHEDIRHFFSTMEEFVSKSDLFQNRADIEQLN
ncbi:MAG: pyridoxal phosphate-dependent decarboxylase family protein [Saprospiraceae bacterium]|jgi:glutamate/tyrosine decarboxylase-like PLP-dependent enzyme